MPGPYVVGDIPTGPSSDATVAELRQQLDALVVRHAVVTIAMQEVLRSVELPTARHLSRTITARVALLMDAVADDACAATAQAAAEEELQGLLFKLWR